MSNKTVSSDVRALADKFKAGMVLNDDGVFTASPTAFQEELATATGIAAETLEKLQSFTTTAIAAGALAAGEIGIEAMQKNADLRQVTGSIPMFGQDNIGYTFNRSARVPNDPDAKSYGSILVGVNIHGAGKSRGELAIVAADLKARAAAALAE